MKRVVAIIFVVFSFLVLLPQFGLVYAQNLCPAAFSNLCGSNITTSITSLSIVGNVVQILFVLAIVLALFFLIWGGIRWIISGGDKAKVTAARDTLIAAVVGLIITLLAYFILNIVVTLITGSPLTNLKLPTTLFQ